MAEAKPNFEAKKACGTCKFGELHKDVRFVVCRRLPPSPVTTPVRQGAQTGFMQLGYTFPTMPKQEWCHEYQGRGTFTINDHPEGSKQ